MVGVTSNVGSIYIVYLFTVPLYSTRENTRAEQVALWGSRSTRAQRIQTREQNDRAIGGRYMRYVICAHAAAHSIDKTGTVIATFYRIKVQITRPK